MNRNNIRKQSSSRIRSFSDLKLQAFEYINDKSKEIKKDLREDFDRDVEKYKRDLRSSIHKYITIIVIILGILGLTSIGGIISSVKWLNKKTSDILTTEVNRINQQISDRLDQEFESERIKSLIEEKAKYYTENRAETLISGKVDSTFKQFENEIKTIVANANTQLEGLREIIELDDAAKFGSLISYKKLSKLASSKKKYSQMAFRRIVVINRDLDIYRQPPSMYQGLALEKNGKSTSAEELSTAELFKELEDPRLPNNIRHTLMVYIINKPEKEICTEAVKLLKNSDSLPASAATCGILDSKFKSKAQFLDFVAWKKFCENYINSKKQ